MNKNKIAETAKKGQTAKKKQQPVKALEKIKKRRENKQLNIEDLKKNTKVPNGKIKTLEEIEARKKAREENYRNFRINALKRRCKRMKVGKEDTNKYIEELKKQLDSPNTYHILIMFNNNDAQIVREGLKNNKIDWLMFCDHHAYVDGDSSTLDKIRSIVPIAKGNGVYPYVKRKPTIGPKANTHNEKKPTNNTTNKNVVDGFVNAINAIGNMPSPFVKYCSVITGKEFSLEEYEE